MQDGKGFIRVAGKAGLNPGTTVLNLHPGSRTKMPTSQKINVIDRLPEE
jgi:hypothetical protein